MGDITVHGSDEPDKSSYIEITIDDSEIKQRLGKFEFHFEKDHRKWSSHRRPDARTVYQAYNDTWEEAEPKKVKPEVKSWRVDFDHKDEYPGSKYKFIRLHCESLTPFFEQITVNVIDCEVVE